MSYKLINANGIKYDSNDCITRKEIEEMPYIYADLPNGLNGKGYNVSEWGKKTFNWKFSPEETKEIMHKMMLQLKPCVLYIHPNDYKKLKNYEIMDRYLVIETENVKEGEAFAANREKLETWSLGQEKE